MRRIDELHLDYPFARSRMLRDLLRGECIAIGRERVTTMMRRIAIEAIYRRPHTSKPADGHMAFPYLLRGMRIERPNQVWAMDITYIPMARGFVYLSQRGGGLVQPASARLRRLSISMEVDFCLDALEEALARHGRPEIFNTDHKGPVHQRGVHWPAAGQLDPDQYGWPAARGATTCSSSDCGVRSNMRRSTCAPAPVAEARGSGSALFLPSTTVRGPTL